MNNNRKASGFCKGMMLLVIIFSLISDHLYAQDPVRVPQMTTPTIWQPKLRVWDRDQNQNLIDDLIEEDSTKLFSIIVDFNRAIKLKDSALLATMGKVTYVGKFISAICVDSISYTSIWGLVSDPTLGVAMVEKALIYGTDLDVSAREIKARASANYSPQTAEDLGNDGDGVVIGIMDTGVDDMGTGSVGTTHEALPAYKYIGGYDAISGSFVNPNDGHGHGTHVASIALGDPPGIATYRGVAPKAHLVDIKVISDDGFGTSAQILDGLETAIAMRNTWNLKVINMSIGTSSSSNGSDAFSQLVNLAVNFGIVVVAAAGNSGPSNTYLGAPSAASLGITVAASAHLGTVDRSDAVIATFSSRGPRTAGADGHLADLKPDITAPGTNTASGSTGIMAARHNTVSSYISFPGTSMASPAVAGAAALVLKAHPAMNPGSVKDLLKRTAQQFGGTGCTGDASDPSWNRCWGYGLLDCGNALATAAGADPGFPSVASPGWLSPDLNTVNPPQTGVPNTIYATVHNFGPGMVLNALLTIALYDFGASPPNQRTELGSMHFSLANGASTTLNLPWTPSVAGHRCLKAEINYGSDVNFSNNTANHNLNIQTGYGGGGGMMLAKSSTTFYEYDFRIQNTLDDPRTLPLFLNAVLSDTVNWELEFVNGSVFQLSPFDGPQNVVVRLKPLGAAYGDVRADIEAFIQPDSLAPVSLGGISVMYQLEAPETTKYRTFTADQLSASTEAKPVKKPKIGKPFPVDRAPNTANLIADIFRSGGQMIIGLPGQLNAGAKEKGYLYPLKQTEVFKSLNVKDVKHTAAPRGFDFDNKGKLILKRQKSIPPTKKNNELIANLIALHVNLLASDLQYTQHGLGALVYTGEGAFSSMTIDDIADSAGALMTNWEGVPFSVYEDLNSTMEQINAAFLSASVRDTTDDGGWTAPQLKWKAYVALEDVHYLEGVEGIIPRSRHMRPENNIPEVFVLRQSYPNPFNPSAMIQFELPEPSIISLHVYNILGQEVAKLLDHEEFEEGVSSVEFDASGFSSGVYYYRISAVSILDASKKFTQVKNMVLVK